MINLTQTSSLLMTCPECKGVGSYPFYDLNAKTTSCMRIPCMKCLGTGQVQYDYLELLKNYVYLQSN